MCFVVEGEAILLILARSVGFWSERSTTESTKRMFKHVLRVFRGRIVSKHVVRSTIKNLLSLMVKIRRTIIRPVLRALTLTDCNILPVQLSQLTLVTIQILILQAAPPEPLSTFSLGVLGLLRLFLSYAPSFRPLSHLLSSMLDE